LGPAPAGRSGNGYTQRRSPSLAGSSSRSGTWSLLAGASAERGWRCVGGGPEPSWAPLGPALLPGHGMLPVDSQSLPGCDRNLPPPALTQKRPVSCRGPERSHPRPAGQPRPRRNRTGRSGGQPGANVIFCRWGAGEIHLAVAPGVKAIQTGCGTDSVRAHEFLEHLRPAQVGERLDRACGSTQSPGRSS